MNGEESLSLPRTLCTESQEGKQDLAFIGVILGNREIDSDKYLFCLNVCVSWLLLYTEVTLCHANSIYIYALNTGKVLTLALVHLLHIISRLVVCRIMKQAACLRRKMCQACPPPQKTLARAQQAQKPGDC